MSTASDIFAAEQRRLELLIASDYAGLAKLLADDLVHVHANGSIEGKSGFLSTIEAQLEFVEMNRDHLDTQVHGDVAISTGPLKQTVRIKATNDIVPVEIFTTQVWRREGDAWLLSNFHATRTAAH
jgi:ketosteroid isomerase-like protein